MDGMKKVSWRGPDNIKGHRKKKKLVSQVNRGPEILYLQIR
jgi:hypothetical protein